MKYLLLGIVSAILGVALGFYVCKNTYQPQVAKLKEQIAAIEVELKDSKNNVRLVFSHNEDCTVGDTTQ